MSNSSFDINLVYQSLRETKSRINLNFAEKRISHCERRSLEAISIARRAYKSLRETKSRSNLNCAVGRIASLALAMTREAYKSLRETKSRINLNCAVGRHN